MSVSRKIDYLLSNIRLFSYKRRKSFEGTFFQRIPTSISVVIKDKGKISLSEGVLFRGPGYMAVSDNGRLIIEKNVFVNTSSYIVSKEAIYIGEGTVIGPNVCIVDHDHDYRSDNMRNTFKCGEVKIGKHVWIGANAVILRGTSIGDNCVVGAGTVVSGVYENDTLIMNTREVIVKKIEKSHHIDVGVCENKNEK